jgi:LDH2 family malate/lactate/ureidoglycolate dehydrogenase
MPSRGWRPAGRRGAPATVGPPEPPATATFPADRLSAFAGEAFVRLGVAAEDAQLLADSLVQADAWGHASHGVMRTFWYGARLETGAMARATRPEFVADAGGLAVLDGHDGIGQVVAKRAMESAIDRAQAHGIGAVAVRGSGHFGTAMYFTRMAAAAGCIGFLSTNASPAMAPWGAREKRVGTNPWSWAAPAGSFPPMMLDVANTAVARGKLYVARQRGQAIPEGWAMDEDGRPTTDPGLGIAGTILPMAGHKGYAIAVLMDVVSGVLSGSAFGGAVVGPYRAEARSGAGHLAIAIDIAVCRPLDAFEADMEALIRDLKSTPPAPGFDEVLYPGEPEARHAARCAVDGIELPAATVAELNGHARRIGVAELP